VLTIGLRIKKFARIVALKEKLQMRIIKNAIVKNMNAKLSFHWMVRNVFVLMIEKIESIPIVKAMKKTLLNIIINAKFALIFTLLVMIMSRALANNNATMMR